MLVMTYMRKVEGVDAPEDHLSMVEGVDAPEDLPEHGGRSVDAPEDLPERCGMSGCSL